MTNPTSEPPHLPLLIKIIAWFSIVWGLIPVAAFAFFVYSDFDDWMPRDGLHLYVLQAFLLFALFILLLLSLVACGIGLLLRRNWARVGLISSYISIWAFALASKLFLPASSPERSETPVENLIFFLASAGLVALIVWYLMSRKVRQIFHHPGAAL